MPKALGWFWSATGGELPERGVKMVKEAEVLEVKDEANGNDGEVVESQPVTPYRIICNSEHFIVLNPVQRKTVKKERVRVNDRADIN